MAKLAAVLVIFEIYFMKQATSGSSYHHYAAGDVVPLYANKVGPFHNPSETYEAIKKDFYEFSPNEESSNSQEERGWKYIGCDVFRYPHHRSLLAAVIGTGIQLCTITTFILSLGVPGTIYPYDRGNLLVVLVILYAVSSGVAGYVAVSFYCLLGGTDWVKNLMLTGYVSYGPLLFTFCFHNTVAGACKANAELSFSTILVLSSIWMPVALPILALGGGIGRKFHAEFGTPCEVSKCPREIPPLHWYRGAPVQMVSAETLPFCVSYTEIYYILASVWGHINYTLYHILVIVFILLLIPTSLVAVAFTHFQLATEDHRWWWRSFLCGDSTGVYIYASTIITRGQILPASCKPVSF